MNSTTTTTSPSMGRKHGNMIIQIFALTLLLGVLVLIGSVVWNTYREPYLGRVYQFETVDQNGFTAKTVHFQKEGYVFKDHTTVFKRDSDSGLIKAFKDEIVPGRYCFFWREGSDNGITMATTAEIEVAKAWAEGGPEQYDHYEFYRWLEDPVGYNRANPKP